MSSKGLVKQCFTRPLLLIKLSLLFSVQFSGYHGTVMLLIIQFQ